MIGRTCWISIWAALSCILRPRQGLFMRQMSGRIINITSISGLRGVPGQIQLLGVQGRHGGAD